MVFFSSFYSNWHLALVAQVALTHHKGGKGKMLYMADWRQQTTPRCSLGYKEAVTFHRDKQATYFKQVGKFRVESRQLSISDKHHPGKGTTSGVEQTFYTPYI